MHCSYYLNSLGLGPNFVGFTHLTNLCFSPLVSPKLTIGYEITRDDIQSQPKKVEAILKLSPPKTKHQLRHLLGMINYYRGKEKPHVSSNNWISEPTC
jgi:hypothetical protein